MLRVCAPPDPNAVKLKDVGETVSGPGEGEGVGVAGVVTTTGIEIAPCTVSDTMRAQVPACVGVTVNADEGPVPELGETVTICVGVVQDDASMLNVPT